MATPHVNGTCLCGKPQKGLIDSKCVHFGGFWGNPIPDPRCNCYACDEARAGGITKATAEPCPVYGVADLAKALKDIYPTEVIRRAKRDLGVANGS